MARTMKAGQFNGVVREHLSVADLALVESEYEAGHRLSAHAHEQPFFSFLVRGSFDEKLGRATRACVPTSLVFYPEQEDHQEVFGPRGARAFNVELGPRWLRRMKSEGMVYAPGSTESLEGRRNLLVSRLYAWFLSDGRDVRPEIAVEEIVLELLAEVTPSAHLGHECAPPPWLARLEELLHERCCETVRVGDLADEAGVHPVHAARVFRRHFGCTIGEYVRTLRIERARRALADEERSLSAIALSTGFSDQAHFTRRFKELIGVPPGEYRRLVTA